MVKPVSQLGTVLKVKQHQEKVAQQQFVEVQDAHLKEQEALARLENKRQEAEKDTVQFGRARATDLQTQRAFIFKLSKQINHQSSKVDEMKIQEDEKRQVLTERAQSRQMVEKLDERRKAEASRILDRKEQQMIDELANRIVKKV